MEEKDENGIKYTDVVSQIYTYLQELQTANQYHIGDEVDLDVDELNKIANNGWSKGIANQVANAGTTIQYSNPKKEKEHTLTRDGGFFIYWLMMHLAFLEDDGYSSSYPTIFSNVTTWGASIIRSGVYNDFDRAFLEEVREYMNKRKWVYKKPVLNEHNDTLPLIERLPITATKIKV